MAKDKEFEKIYKLEKLRRVAIRKKARRGTRAYKKWRYGDHRDSQCPYCGGTRSWCTCCQMWSSYCCEKYGTCQCS